MSVCLLTHGWFGLAGQGVSTTGIIVRIIHDYDKFVRRNLKRGLTGKEMNVPYIKVCTEQHQCLACRFACVHACSCLFWCVAGGNTGKGHPN